MFGWFSKKTLFLKTVIAVVTAQFILSSIPVFAYETLDQLRPKSATQTDGGVGVLKDELIKLSLGKLAPFVGIASEGVVIGGEDAKAQGQRVGRTATLAQLKDLGIDTAIQGHSATRSDYVTDVSKNIKPLLKQTVKSLINDNSIQKESEYEQAVVKALNQVSEEYSRENWLELETIVKVEPYAVTAAKISLKESIANAKKEGRVFNYREAILDVFSHFQAREIASVRYDRRLNRRILGQRKEGIKTITLCVGSETKNLPVEAEIQAIQRQLGIDLENVNAEQLKEKEFLLAFEPSGKIGTGEAAETDYIRQVHQAIFDWLEAKYGNELIRSVWGKTFFLLYGASVDGNNIDGIMAVQSARPDMKGTPLVHGALFASSGKKVPGFLAVAKGINKAGGGVCFLNLKAFRKTEKTPPVEYIREIYAAINRGEIDPLRTRLYIADQDVNLEGWKAALNKIHSEFVRVNKEKALALSPSAGPYDAEFPKIATFDDIGKTLDVRNKVVLYSPDINVPLPLDPKHGRFVATAESLKELLDNGAKVVLIYHQARPGEPDFIDEPFQHAKILNDLVGGNRVRAVNDLFGKEAIAAIKGLQAGQCIVLRQVRAKDPVTGKTLEESPWFVPTLRPLVDIFALGGLSVLHRDTQRITGFKNVPTIADRLMVKEIKTARSERSPQRPHLEVIGGSKVEKIKAIIAQLKSDGKTDMSLIGGVPAEAALVAAQMEPGKDYNDEALFALAKSVLGPAAAEALQKADDGKFFALLPELAEAIQKNGNRIALPKDMAYMDGETKASVTLVNGRVPAGFNHVLSGIGPQTDDYYASIVSRSENPFKSANLVGPLVDSRKKVLLDYMSKTAKAVSQMEDWATGGGDTDIAIKSLGLNPPFSSLAGGARQDFLDGKHLAGIDFAIDNSPAALKDKSFVPSTDAEAHVLAHANVFGDLAKAMKEAGGKIVARTDIFIRGQEVGTIKVTPTPMDTVLKLSMGELADVYTGLQAWEVDTQNPWIDFSITTLRTPVNDRRRINADALRQILSADPNLAVILLQGEYNAKKQKYGSPGEIKTRTIEERLNSVLLRLLRAKGIDPESMPKSSRPLPTMVQVTESSIPGWLKIAVFVPTPNTDIYRLMQLAQDSGINLKELFEQSKDINDHKFLETMKGLKAKPQIALLGDVLPVPPAPPETKEQGIGEFAQLEGLTFGGAKIDIKTQTIITKDSRRENLADIWPVLERVRKTKKLVRIMVPEGSKAERSLKDLLGSAAKGAIEEIKGLVISTHSIVRGSDKFTAFIISPEIPTIIVGYGNEAIKVAPVLEASGIGKLAVAINSLDRLERVIHAFLMGYDVYHADQVQVDKETKKESLLYDKEPQKLKEFEDNLFKLLREASIAEARNELLKGVPLSERTDAKNAEVNRQAEIIGESKAKDMFTRQYKGLVSVALNAGKFKVVVDATPEGIGAQNKKLFYQPAAKLNPGMLFIYQGGEKEGIGESFSNVAVLYDDLREQGHVRHVSCNTTALSTLGLSLIPYLKSALAINNLAIRRVRDPGDFKGDILNPQLVASYHHWPDFVEVTPDEIMETIEIPGVVDKDGNPAFYGNTDAAQAGAVTMYHHHILSLVRLDGQPIDINKVKESLAARPDVALVDMPAGVFNGTRIVELAHNLLPQAVREAPDGANHLLVPVVMVQPTDDPAEVIMIIAVPQESIVARGQTHIIHAALGIASKDASTEVVNDAVGATALVEGIEVRLPASVSAANAVARDGGKPISDYIGRISDAFKATVEKVKGFLDSDKKIYDTTGGNLFDKFIDTLKKILKPEKKAGALENLEAKSEKIADSRGQSTVRIKLQLGDLTTTGEVPAGKSKGELEAPTVSTEKAISNINNVILPLLKDSKLDLSKHEDLIKASELLDKLVVADRDLYRELLREYKDAATREQILEEKAIGANATVPVFWALWGLAAKLNHLELGEYIKQNFPESVADNKFTYFFINNGNGGQHALKDENEVLGKDRISIQEIMFVPVKKRITYKEALAMGDKLDRKLKEILIKKYGAENISRADEAGFSVKGVIKGLKQSVKSTDIVAAMVEAIKAAGFEPGTEVKIGFDAAANSFFKKELNKYDIDGELKTTDEMIQYYLDLTQAYPGVISSIEDGLHENDIQGWIKLTKAMKEKGVITIGDDLFVTQRDRLEQGIREGWASAILIKVNQNGSLLDTLKVMALAKANNILCIVSHRSGETKFTGIADLAWGTNAAGVKTGATQPLDDPDFKDKNLLVRRPKYERMAWLQEYVADKARAVIAGPDFFKLGGSTNALIKSTELLGDNLKLGFYGVDEAKIQALFGENKNIIIAKSLNELMTALAEAGVKQNNVVLMKPQATILQIKHLLFSGNDISTEVLSKAITEALKTSEANNALNTLHQEMKDNQVISAETYENSKQAMRTQLKDAQLFELPEIKVTETVSEKITSERETAANFVSEYITKI